MNQILLTGSVVLASFLGGLFAVLIGQFLTYYREQKQSIEELHLKIKAVRNLESYNTPYSPADEDLNQLVDDLQRLFLENEWWMDPEMKHNVSGVIRSIQHILRNRKNIRRGSKELDSNIGPDELLDYRKDADRLNEYIEEQTDQLERVPMRRFIPRYLGYH
ncbi:hypothetical protein [Halobellus limi]|uniref:hypothetical protein n=1 Tax=Halobellus limi TaxID=699433 RepID=UPI0010A53724|nr:hypothetical protein [Halobellus limi]